MPRVRLALAALALAASTGLPACDRPDDLPHKRDEVLATARRYDARFEELKHRAEKLAERLIERDRAVPSGTPNLAAHQHRLGDTLTAIDENRSYLQKLPSALDGFTKTGSTRELQKLLDALRERMDDGVRATISDLSEVESWTGLVEQGILQAQPTPQPTPEAPNEPPDEPGADQDPARGADGPVR